MGKLLPNTALLGIDGETRGRPFALRQNSFQLSQFLTSFKLEDHRQNCQKKRNHKHAECNALSEYLGIGQRYRCMARDKETKPACARLGGYKSD